jgi:CBS domain-containing protein
MRRVSIATKLHATPGRPESELLRLVHARPEVSPGATVRDVIRLMVEGEVGAVAVTEGRRVVGIFTERDLMTRVVWERRDPARTPVREVMSSPVQMVSVDASIAEAAAVMREHHIRHLAVVDEDGDLLGLVAQRYLLYQMLGSLEVKVDDLQGYIMADGPGG